MHLIVAHHSWAAVQRSRIYACSHCSSLSRLPRPHSATHAHTRSPHKPRRHEHCASPDHSHAHHHHRHAMPRALSFSKVQKLHFPHADHSVFFNRLSYRTSRRHALAQQAHTHTHTHTHTRNCAPACTRRQVRFQGLEFASHSGTPQLGCSATQSDICLFSLLITLPPASPAQCDTRTHVPPCIKQVPEFWFSRRNM